MLANTHSNQTGHAQNDSIDLSSSTSVATRHSVPKSLVMEEEMVELYRSIEQALPGTQSRALQFISAQEGEGTSTIVRYFASTAVTRFNQSVLILNANASNPSQHIYFVIKPKPDQEEIPVHDQPADDTTHKAKVVNISISRVLPDSQLTKRLVNAYDFKEHIDKLKKKFDLVIIDSVSASKSSEGITLSACVDGVVLVVEAENTRWQVVDNVKQKIIRNSGNLLGIVLNKRRFYTPEFIYKRI